MKVKKNINKILSMVLSCLVLVSAYTNCSSSPETAHFPEEQEVMMASK